MCVFFFFPPFLQWSFFLLVHLVGFLSFTYRGALGSPPTRFPVSWAGHPTRSLSIMDSALQLCVDRAHVLPSGGPVPRHARLPQVARSRHHWCRARAQAGTHGMGGARRRPWPVLRPVAADAGLDLRCRCHWDRSGSGAACGLAATSHVNLGSNGNGSTQMPGSVLARAKVYVSPTMTVV